MSSFSATSGISCATSAAPPPSCHARATGIGIAGIGANRLHPGPVGRCPLVLAAAAPVDPCAADARVGGELLGRPGLPDARLPHQQLQRPSAAQRRVHRLAQPVELHARGRRRRRRPGSRGDWRGAASSSSFSSMASRISCRAAAAFAGRSSGLLASSASHGAVERLGDVGVVPRGRHRVGVQVLADDRDRVVAREGRLAGEHLVEQGAERIEIAARARRRRRGPARAGGRRPCRPACRR